MLITLSTLTTTLAQNQIIVATSATELEKFGFAEEVMAHVNKQIAADKTSIVLNLYNRFVFIQLIETKTTTNDTLEAMRVAGFKLLVKLNTHQITNVVVIDAAHQKKETLALIEGILLSNYEFAGYYKETPVKINYLENIQVDSQKITEKDLHALYTITKAVYKARDLVNTPYCFLNAAQLATTFEAMGKEAGFKTEILGLSKIRSLKMGGLLGVNAGSEQPPTFTIMTYKPKNATNKKPYVLVGKGVVFDTGGISLKPSPGMEEMKCDMGGGATVGATMQAIAELKLPIYVIGMVPATDNRINGKEILLGDILTMMDGTTVEVLNTDAEGRLILGDALHYAKKFNPELVIDLATLTGAALRAIGHTGSIAFSNNEKAIKQLKEAGEKVYERLVEFPLWEEYKEMLKSDVADMKNIGGPLGGANTAAKFLEHFTDYPWIHLDIAGTAFLPSKDNYRGKGGTGVGVRLLVEFLQEKI